jgi:transcriptional regulator with XRE-family HTH domain
MDDDIREPGEEAEVYAEEFVKEALDSYYKTIGDRIKKAREDTGYTQGKVAASLGLTTSAIANYEAGTRQIPVHALVFLAQTYGKPLNYFLGADVETPMLLKKGLKDAVERFTDASYVEFFYELKNGHLQRIEQPLPMIPLPPEIAKDHHHAIREYNEKTGTYNYYLVKVYHPDLKSTGIPFINRKTIRNYIKPEPDDLVIAEIGDTGKMEMVQFKNMTPAADWNGTGDVYTVNIRYLVIAKIERLVK